MRSMWFYDELSDLNDNLYGGAEDYKNFKLLDILDDKTSGTYIALYKRNQKVFFCIRGSQLDFENHDFDYKDLMEDIILWATKSTKQAEVASKYYNNIKNKYANIIFTGYSLGGSVAQLLCKQFGNETVCFEPYGTGKAKGNCINFGNFGDIVFMQNPNEMVGEIYLIPMKMPKHGKRWLDTHLPKCHGKPSTAKKYNGKLEENATYFKRISINKGKEIYDVSKKYLRNGIIPSVQQRINSL